MSKSKIRKSITLGFVIATLLMLTQSISAATFINVISGPTWGNDGPYSATICTNTAIGETVYTQSSTGSPALDLTGDNGTNPTSHPSWNGTVVACAFDQFEPVSCGGPGSGEGTWICSFNDTPSTNIKYRFLVANQSNVFYGQVTAQGSINTGPLAITLADLSATRATASSLPLAATAGASALAALGAGFVTWRRRK